MFEFVKIAGFGVKNVYHGGEIIHQYPFGDTATFGMRRSGLEFVLYLFIDTVRNRFDVGIGIAFADDEKVCRSITELPQVELYDSFTFLVADTFNDEVIELFELRLFCPQFGSTDQIS